MEIMECGVALNNYQKKEVDFIHLFFIKDSYFSFLSAINHPVDSHDRRSCNK